MKILKLLVVCLSLAGSAFAQTTVTAADLNKLDADALRVSQQITGLKRADPTLAAASEKTLAELQDELTYLKVKLRREGSVPAKDVADLRDRIETLRVKTQGQTVTAKPIMSNEPVEKVYKVPVRTQMDVRLQTPLSSATAKVEQRFEATTLVDVAMMGAVVIPAGTVTRGFVSSVRPAGSSEKAALPCRSMRWPSAGSIRRCAHRSCRRSMARWATMPDALARARRWAQFSAGSSAGVRACWPAF